MRPLRIFYASDTTPNAWFRDVRSNIWRNNLLLPLIDLGHEVVEFQYDLTQTFRNLDPGNARHAAFIAENRPKVSAELLRQVRAAHGEAGGRPIDLFFSYFYDACVEPAAIDAIRAMGIKTANWYCNASYQIHLVKEISPRYDYCLVPEQFRLEDYKAMGARPIYCQEAANPQIYVPRDVRKEFDVTFVGQAYGDRPMLIGRLLAAGLNVQMWGHGWVKPHAASMSRETFEAIEAIPERLRHEPLSDEQLIAMYSRSKINLGFSLCDTQKDGRRIEQLRLRDFEIPMAGGFYMTGHMEELTHFFVPGREIVTYHDADDLVAKVKHYLAHREQREAVARAGRERALLDHTWQKRFTVAFGQMGLAEKI